MDYRHLLIPRNLIHALSYENLDHREFTGDIKIVFSRLKNLNNYSVEIVGDNSNYNVRVEKINLWMINLFKTYLNIAVQRKREKWILSSRVIYRPFAKLLILIYILSGGFIGIQTGNIWIAIMFTIFAIHLISLLLKVIRCFTNENTTDILNKLALGSVPSK